MLIVELIPLNKGNHLILDNTTITTIGRTPNIGCLNNKISRNHAQLFIKSDGTVWIKPIHHNPTFYKTKTNQIVSLTKDKEYQLFDNDQFGLLPDEYFYQVSIKSKDEEKEINSSPIPKSPTKENEILTIENYDEEKEINSSTIPKSPIKENEILTIENHDEEKTESISDTTRALPTWMSNSSASTSTSEKKLSKEKTVTTPRVRERIHPEGKKTREILYDDDDDEPATTTSSTDKAGISNDNNLATTNSQTSSIITNSTKRERCPYGESCYRKNPVHRQQAIHPGDSDWETEEDDKDKTKPECPYGNECYRKNPDHLNEYHHPKKRFVEIKTKRRSTKHKVIEEDDDGLPNEYDHNDSFIDDEDFDSTDSSTNEEETDDDTEWKPVEKKSRYLNETDDDSTDDSDKELAKQEAAEFIKSSTANHDSPVIKKPRVDDE